MMSAYTVLPQQRNGLLILSILLFTAHDRQPSIEEAIIKTHLLSRSVADLLSSPPSVTHTYIIEGAKPMEVKKRSHIDYWAQEKVWPAGFSEETVDTTTTTHARTEQSPSYATSTLSIGRGRALSWEDLRMRRISSGAASEEISEYFKGMLIVAPLRYKDTLGLAVIAREFLNNCCETSPNQDYHTLVEDLFNKINSWRFARHLPSVTNRDFEWDKALCKNSTEAVIERTLMISIIDRGQLCDLFVFSCDGQWNLETEYLLPTSGRVTEVILPRPGLAMFFQLAALTGDDFWAPYPQEIGQCLHPDGGDERCFPFLVMEVYGATTSRDVALRANTHSASQSLYNTYTWMTRAGKQGVFFDKVQVFSIVLNADYISLRVHWAVLEEGEYLSFRFDDIVSLPGYGRDQACQLVHKVMEYAEKKLYVVFRETFQHVSQQEQRCS